jgi:hypothetical protein
VHGSPTSYGNIYLNRNLTLIGTGYNPQKDNPLVSAIATLYLDSVPGIKGCSNSKIIGFNITSSLATRAKLLRLQQHCYCSESHQSIVFSACEWQQHCSEAKCHQLYLQLAELQ